MSNEKYFSNFIDLLDISWDRFYLWRYIYDKKYQDIRDSYYFFDILLQSLRDSAVLSLFKLLDGREDFNIHKLIENTQGKYEVCEEKRSFLLEKQIDVKKWRDKYFCHNDKEVVCKEIDLEKVAKIIYNEIEEMLNALVEIVDVVVGYYDPGNVGYDCYYNDRKVGIIDSLDIFFSNHEIR